MRLKFRGRAFCYECLTPEGSLEVLAATSSIRPFASISSPVESQTKGCGTVMRAKPRIGVSLREKEEAFVP